MYWKLMILRWETEERIRSSSIDVLNIIFIEEFKVKPVKPYNFIDS